MDSETWRKYKQRMWYLSMQGTHLNQGVNFKYPH